MKKYTEFFVPYIEDSFGVQTKKFIKRFVWFILAALILCSLIFSLTQKEFRNSTFDLMEETMVTGIYHEDPYPMLRVEVAEGSFKNILLLGFGKSSVNPYLKTIRKKHKTLVGKRMTIQGNLIYYNGKTLLQITSEEKVALMSTWQTYSIPKSNTVGEMTVHGEIIDPKCYFGVMKPGYGKIHRSCAVRCISGGIPPVLAASDEQSRPIYYLITDLEGDPINKDILPFVGKPAEIKGTVEKMEDWYRLKIDVDDIETTGQTSLIY